MKICRAILLLVLAISIGACSTVSPRTPVKQRSAARAPSAAPPHPFESQPQETSIDISKKPKDSKSGTPDASARPVLPSLRGVLQSGLLGPPTAEKPEKSALPDKDKQKIVLNFEKADVSEVTNQIFGDYLKLNYVLDPALQGWISLYLEGEFTKEELLAIVVKAYEANNISIAGKKGIYYIQPIQRSSSSSLPVANALTLKEEKTGSKPVIVIYRLRYMDVKQAINTVKFFLSPGRPITSDSLTNSLIFVEDSDNAQTILDVLKSLDINILKEVSMEIVPLQGIAPQDAAQSMEALINKLDIFKNSSIKGNIAFIPLQNFGGLLVLAQNQELVKTAKYWLSALDVQSQESGEQIYVYFVQNGLAKDIGDILNQVYGLQGGGGGRAEQQIVQSTTRSGYGGSTFGKGSSSGSAFGSGGGLGSSSVTRSFGSSSGSQSMGSSLGSSGTGSSFGSPGTLSGGQSSGTGSTFKRGGTSGVASTRAGAGTMMAPSLTGEVILIADEVNNALVIRANATDYAKIKKTIETLDILPRAVLVEVVIAEVALNKSMEYGLQWYFRTAGVGGGALTTSYQGLSSPPDLAAVGAAAAGGLAAGWVSTGQDIAQMLRLLSSKTDVKVLSTPTLLATDNKEATITVGGREPVPTGSYSTSGTSTSVNDVFSTISYEETGIILNVTPHINAGGLVRLEVEQTIRRVGDSKTVGAGNTAPTFTERNVKTTLLAQNGSTSVIGGIIEQAQNDGKSGIPFLSDVPILSPLFANKKRSTIRTELLIAITPHVVDHRQSDVTREFLEKLKQLKGRTGVY